MDFSSIDLTESNELTSLGVENFNPDTSPFYDFFDPTNFNATTTGTDQQGADSHAGTNYSDSTTNPSTPLTNSNVYPLLSPMNIDPFLTPSQQPTNVECLEDEDFLTPLVSPAIPPNYFGNFRTDTNFSPLTSPALGPQVYGSIGHQLEEHQLSTYSTQQVHSSEKLLQEQLAMIERQQRQLRSHIQQQPSSSSPVQKPTPAYGTMPFMSSSTTTSSVSIKPKQQTLRHKIAMSSPKFNPATHLRSPSIQPQTTPTVTPLQSPTFSTTSHHTKTHTTMAPATPSLLMKLGNGPTHHQNIHNDSNNSAMIPSHDTMIDTMMTLPDAMLPSPAPSSAIKKTTHMDPHKRRRISYPRSAFTPPALIPTNTPSPSANGIMPLDQGIAALISPAALRPHPPPTNTGLLSSPGMSQKIGNGNGSITSSPRALKPWISPALHPKCNTDEQEAATILASKSNYQALRDGQATSSLLGMDFSTTIPSGMDHRRSAHKAAEQRRRDTLKQCFDALRMELLESMVEEDALLEDDDDDKNEKWATALMEEREKKIKQMSKVVLLQHSYEHLLRLKSDHQRKQAKMEQMTVEIQQLRTRLGMAPVTEQERQAEAEEKQEQKKNRLARLKRWEDIVDS